MHAHDGLSNRSRTWRFWASLVLLYAVGTASFAAAPTDTVSGSWQRHRLQFNCVRCGSSNELLRLRITNLLQRSGARLNAPVVFSGHGGLDYASLDYSTLQPVSVTTSSTTAPVSGRWQAVRFQLNLGSMDQTENFPCELLYYFKTDLLHTFHIRHLSADLPCESFVPTPNYFLAFEVFMPASGQ